MKKQDRDLKRRQKRSLKPLRPERMPRTYSYWVFSVRKAIMLIQRGNARLNSYIFTITCFTLGKSTPILCFFNLSYSCRSTQTWCQVINMYLYFSMHMLLCNMKLFMDICSVFPVEGTIHSLIQQILIGYILCVSSVVTVGCGVASKAGLPSALTEQIPVERCEH